MPTGRTTPPTDTSIVGSTSPQLTGTPGFALGLTTADLTLSPPLTAHTITQTNVDTSGSVAATWLSGPAGIATSPLAPTLPLDAENVTVPGQVLRGVGFRSGAFTDSTVVPLTGTPTTEIRGVHSPFSSSSFYPARPWSINYFDALADAGGATRLMLTPAQYRSTSFGSQTSTQRQYSSLGLRLYYSNNTTTTADGSTPALSAPPSIVDVAADPSGGGVAFSVHVVGNPAAGIQGTWVTYSSAAGNNWTSLDLTQDPTDSTLWTGTLPSGAVTPLSNLRFIVQSVNGVGLVTLDDNNGAYYRIGASDTAPEPAATHLAISSPAANGSFSYGQSITVAADLTEDGGAPVAGQPVTFAVGSQTVVDTTNASGHAQATMPLVVRPGGYTLRASFGGSLADEPSSDESPLSVTKQPTSLALSPSNAVAAPGAVGSITATLQAGGEPLSERTVAFILTGPGGPASTTAITDFLGRASLPKVALPAGTYTVKAYFSGTIPFPSGSQTFTDPAYQASTDTATLTFWATLNAGTTTCAGTYSGTGKDVVVPAGATCTLVTSAHVTHDVQVKQGGTLIDQGATIDHDLSADHAAGIQMTGDSVGHDLSISGLGGSAAGGNYVRNVTVDHDLTVQDNTAPIVVSGNKAGHDLKAQNNRPGGITVSGNSAGHDATCQSNSPQSGSGNTAVHKSTCPA